jgi:hypothetical protein
MKRLCSILATGFLLAGPARATTEIWMSAGPHIDHPAPGWEGLRTDAGDMWKPDAPWATVASNVKIMTFVVPNLERVTDSDLKLALDDLKRRHIALAVGTGMIVRSDRCRSNTEAYVNPGALEHIFDKVRRNGGDVKYVGMDEPYFWGHRYSGPTACHESIQAIANAVAESVRLVRRYFPNAQIGDGEPVDQSRPWIDELADWADAYQKATGEKLAFMDADVNWNKESMRNLAPLGKALKARGIPFGIIYNAAALGAEPWFDPNSRSNSDIGWIRNAVSHYTEIESGLGVHPDHAVFVTWVRYPTRMLPETQAGTFTNLVFQYIRQNKKP